MSPTKRSSRTRRGSVRDATVERPDDSSPSRPVKRRKQVQANSSEHDIPEEPDSSLVADTSVVNLHDAVEVVSRVTQNLTSPRDQILQASKDHANAIHEENQEGVQAFAKIAGQDWTYYVTKTTINIGRTSDPPPTHQDEDDKDFVHIDLGPSKMISRQHAMITFNSTWTLEVKGRNGVKLDGEPQKQGVSTPLTSGRVIEVGGIEMIFVLPLDSAPLRIHPTYIERAGLQGTEFSGTGKDAEVVEDALRPTTSSSAVQAVSGRVALPRSQPLPQTIAPAPPDYRRPGTPPSVRSRAVGSQNRSPQFKDGTMLMNPNDVDLSLDENKHIKPQYSYAQMITQAIMNTPDDKLNLNGIYTFIITNYSYYRHQQAAGWQNSIRHNLSLNKAFEKVARSTDEPGKGMKWQIVPEVKDEMTRSAYKGGRGGHRGSSNPSSPNQLNYVNQGPREMAARDLGSSRKRKVSPSGSPQPRSALRDLHMTPDRSSRRLLPGDSGLGIDGSPLPRFRKTATAAVALPSTEATEELQTEDNIPRSPTLTSSYRFCLVLRDSFVVSRASQGLAPPSTAQRPSQHMPTSSPAPFWKYADIGSTPLRGPSALDFSPSRPRLEPLPQSSSPPQGPSKSPVQSPTRRTARLGGELLPPKPGPQEQPPAANEVEEDGGFDLTKGFQSIGSYHAPVSRGFQVAPAANGR
ncbi:forkhead box protein J2 [Magnaporthiopsis poae ATCC 64411]|uniref:Forkhead box protein J2 n=1 Tax=Magnaporthiopsis poae (strain ATCC 64411 / 73-15) TaxID=644358 RepID=A0A0C4DRQ8_MAGP6|nr:forkhead box protein J2 [Magnaporthiopsis poae ATCC 64411]